MNQVLELLASLATRSATEQEIAGLRAVLTSPLPPEVAPGEDCRHCALVTVRAHDAAWHLTRCERHPERLRYAAMHRLARALGGHDGFVDEFSALLQLEFAVDVIEDFPLVLRDALNELGTALGTGLHADALAMLTREARARLHVVSRELDPCPWCAGVFALEGFIAHLSTCRRNPAATHAAVLHDALLERYGEAQVTNQLREDRAAQSLVALRRVLDACTAYEASMGWAGGAVYCTKVWSERPFRRELHRAERFVADERAQRLAWSAALDETLARMTVVAKQSWSFWNGMSDGDRGESLIDEGDCQQWSAAVLAVRRGAGLA